jgi:hypothetical protein
MLFLGWVGDAETALVIMSIYAVLFLVSRCFPWDICFMRSRQNVYEVRPRKDHRSFDLISDALPFGRLWYAEPNAISNAIGYAKFFSRSHDAVIRVFDEAGEMIEWHEHSGAFKEP